MYTVKVRDPKTGKWKIKSVSSAYEATIAACNMYPDGYDLDYSQDPNDPRPLDVIIEDSGRSNLMEARLVKKYHDR